MAGSGSRADQEGAALGGGERLLIEAAQRDPGRFGDLYELHFERIYAFVVRRIHDRQEAQDLTSEVFHRALASLGRFEWRGVPFSAWLFRIAANVITNHFQGRTEEPSRLGADVATFESASETGPEADLAEVEERARLLRCVRNLPEDQRLVVQLRFGEERSIRETAGRLGRTEGAVKQLQFRALQSLRARMNESHG